MPAVPVIPDINQAVFAAVSQPGALDMSRWHTCGTTHCRAGWVVHLAGEAGYALERYHDTALAAQLIYAASGTPISPVRFFADGNDAALADMKRLAEEEAALGRVNDQVATIRRALDGDAEARSASRALGRWAVAVLIVVAVAVGMVIGHFAVKALANAAAAVEQAEQFNGEW